LRSGFAVAMRASPAVPSTFLVLCVFFAREVFILTLFRAFVLRPQDFVTAVDTVGQRHPLQINSGRYLTVLPLPSVRLVA
jgi:hypothetical protein